MSVAQISQRLRPAHGTLCYRGGGGLQIAFAAGLGLIVIGAALFAPPEIAIAVAILGFFFVLALYDTWSMVLFLMLVRSSLDALSDTGVLAGQNIATWLSLLLIGVGLAYIASQRVELRKVPLARPFMALLGVWGAGVVVSLDPVASFQDWLRALGTFLLYVYLVHALSDEGRRDLFLKVVVLSAVLPTMVGLYQLASGTGNEVTEGFNRIFATFAHPSPFAFYLLVILPLAAVMGLHSRTPATRFGAALLSILMAVCIIATFTRIAWLGLLVTLMILLWMRNRAGVMVVPLVVVVAVVLVPGVNDRLLGSGNLDSGEGRLDLWGNALAHTSISQLPFGLGLDSVELLTGNAAHNDYVRLWIETGVLGIAAFAWLYVSAVRLGLQAVRARLPGYGSALAAAFVAVLVARLVMMLTDNLTVHPVLEWYLWALAALIVAVKMSGEDVSRQAAYLPGGRVTAATSPVRRHRA
jgi:O-antigen ligase